MLLRVPRAEVSFRLLVRFVEICAHHDCDCGKMIDVVVGEVCSGKSSVGLKRPLDESGLA